MEEQEEEEQVEEQEEEQQGGGAGGAAEGGRQRLHSRLDKLAGLVRGFTRSRCSLVAAVKLDAVGDRRRVSLLIPLDCIRSHSAAVAPRVGLGVVIRGLGVRLPGPPCALGDAAQNTWCPPNERRESGQVFQEGANESLTSYEHRMWWSCAKGGGELAPEPLRVFTCAVGLGVPLRRVIGGLGVPRLFFPGWPPPPIDRLDRTCRRRRVRILVEGFWSAWMRRRQAHRCDIRDGLRSAQNVVVTLAATKPISVSRPA